MRVPEEWVYVCALDVCGVVTWPLFFVLVWFVRLGHFLSFPLFHFFLFDLCIFVH